jgi:WD40 repeat protein
LAVLVYVHAPNPANERTEITLWDAATDWQPRTFEKTPETFGNAIALSPDGRVFATGRSFDAREGKPYVITLWDAATGKPLKEGPVGREAKVTTGALAFSPDGKKLLWGDKDATVNLWDLETGEVRTFKGHTDTCEGVAFDPKGRWIVSASEDGTVKLWDLNSRHEVHTIPGLSWVSDAALSPDGRYLAATTWPGQLSSRARMWDLTRPKEPREIELKPRGQGGGLSLSFSPDGRYLAAGSSNTVRLWDLQSGECRAVLRGHSGPVFWTAFLDGGQIVVSGSLDRTVRFWDVAQALAECNELSAHRGSVESLVFAPDGLTLFSGGSDGLIRWWDVTTGQKLGQLGSSGISEPVSGLAISPDGRTLAQSRVGLWDLGTARLLELKIEGTGESCVAFSPVGSVVAMGRGGNIRLWDAVTGKLLRPLKTPREHPFHSLAFTPDGQVLASAGEDQKVTLWEVATGRELASDLVGHKGGIVSLAFSPVGRDLVSGSFDGTLVIWDVADPSHPSLRRKLDGNAGSIWAVAYSPDGKSIASGNDDGTVKLWDPTTGRERCTLVGHTARVRTLAFSRGGSVLATGDAEGTIRLWRR